MEALHIGSSSADEAAGARSSARAVAGARLLTLAVGLCGALPIIVASERALREGWQPVADRGIIALRAFDVFSTHMPLVGQYSFASTITGEPTYSLGPMLYWLLAPAAHIGAPASLVLTMGAVNVASVMGAVALARRRGGMWLMLAVAIGVALMCRSLAANNFYDIWNPSAALFPLLLLAMLCWSLACGEHRLLPLTLLVASYCAQCEDAFIPSSAFLTAVGLAGLAVACVRQRRRCPRGRRLPRGARAVGLAALAVVLICWTPAIADQLAGRGNLGLVLKTASRRDSSLGRTVGDAAVVRTLGVVPWWLTRPSNPFTRKHEVRRSPDLLRTWTALSVLAWLVIAGALALARRRREVLTGVATALALCAGVWVVASATPARPRLLADTLGYTLWQASVAGMLAWLIACWSAIVLSGVASRMARVARSLARERIWLCSRARVLAPLGAVALAAVAGSFGAGAGTPDEHSFEFAPLARINSRLGAVPRGHSVYLDARLDGLITPLRPELAYELRRRGVRPLGTGAFLRTGHWYELAEHPHDYTVWVYDNGRLPTPGARVIANVRIRKNRRWHVVRVAISPRNYRPRVPAGGA